MTFKWRNLAIVAVGLVSVMVAAASADEGMWLLNYPPAKALKAKYDFDEELLRPYFPMESVMRGMFELVERLYGIKIAKVEGVAAWNAAVNYFEVRDADGALLGSFYADFYPREDKRGGAWSDSLITGGPMAGGFEPHLGAICGNLTPPVGGKPALLTKRDVETIFHEFGHQLHHVLSRAPIPEELYQKMMRARTFRAASAQMRQLSLGTADLSLHVDYTGEEKDGDIVDYSRKVFQRFTPAPLPSDYGMVASFSHIFSGGYAAGYYSYKWAEVLDADAFTRFRREGIFSAQVGAEFVAKILSRGNSADPMELYRAYLQ